MTSRRNRDERLSLNKSQDEPPGKLKRMEKKILVKFNSGRKKQTKELSQKKSIADQDCFSSDIKHESESKSPSLSDSDLIVISEADSCMSEKNYQFETFCVNKPISAVFPDKLNPSLSENLQLSVLCDELLSKASNPNVSEISCGSNVDIKRNEKQKSFHSTFSPETTLPEIDFGDSTSSFQISKSCLNESSVSQYQSVNFKDSNDSLKLGQSLNMLYGALSSSKTPKENVILNQLNIKPLIKPVEFNYDVNPFSACVDFSLFKAAYDYFMEKSTNIPSSATPFENSIGSEQISSRINASEINSYDTNEPKLFDE